MDARARHFSPAEAARRLGVTVKALRLYEGRGLVAPVRTGAGWRAYGPDQMARLHQILALKRMGLGLAAIGELLAGRASTLASVLALQEQVLAAEGARVAHALALVRAARQRLAAGDALSIDDLATLTKETTMSTKPTAEEMKQIFDPLIARHFSADEVKAFEARELPPVDPAARAQWDAYAREWDVLIAEAKALMAKGDPASPEALDLARRWAAQVHKFSGGDRGVELRMAEVWKDAMADPASAPKLPMDSELWTFVGKAMAATANRN
jgi:DNA-binding transcriptional MerR regulator